MAYRQSALMRKRLAENRQRILSSTRKLIAAGGFKEASVVAVAKEAGLSTGAIYNYFPSKATIFVEVLTAAVDKEVQILRKIAQAYDSPTDQLKAAVETFSTRALAGPHSAYAYIAEPSDPEVEAARILLRRKFHSVFEDILIAGIKSGEFPQQQAGISAACIVGAFTEALIRPVAEEEASKQEKDQEMLTNSISNFCLRAAIS